MIFDWIFNGLYGMFSFFLKFMPTVKLDDSLYDGFLSATEILSTMNRYLPVQEMFVLISLSAGTFIIYNLFFVGSRGYKEVKSFIPFT